MSIKSLSIIVPCYNEEARILSTWNKIIAHSSAIQANVSYVFVNDGSTDSTLSLLTSLTETSSISTKIVSYEDNKGKGYAVKQGVFACESDYYLIMDADGATNMKEINTFLEHTEKADIIIGSRIGHLSNRAIYKRVLGQIAHTIITTTLGLKVKDTQCGFKMFSNAVKYMWNDMKLDRRGFDFELLYLAKKNNIEVLELPVDWQDVSGSKIKMVDYLKTLEELVVVYRNHKLAKIEKYIEIIKKDALRLGVASLATVIFGLNFFATGVSGDNGGGSGSGSSGGSSFSLTTYEAGTMPDTTSPTKRINVGNSGEQDNGGASVAGGKPNAITPDGRYIVFESNATNFIGGPNNGTRQIWIRDVLSGTTTLISQTMSGEIPDAPAFITSAITSDSVSPDGRYVFFNSTSNQLVPGSNGGREQVYLRNVFSGTTTLISADNSGNEGDSHSQGFGMSSGGRYILFKSQASNLVPGDTNGLQDAFVRDVLSGVTLPLNITLSGNVGTGESVATMMTPDGRYVLFDSNSINLVSGVNNGVYNVFVRDMWSGTTTLVTRNTSGALANIDSNSYSITPDGRYVVFRSHATNLVPGDTNGSPDIFVRDMLLGTTTLVNSNLSNGSTSSIAFPEGITSDGRFILFYSDASDLVAGDTNNTYDTFVRDVFSGVTTRVNVGNQGEQDNAGATALGVTKMTPDGRYVFFMSNASDLVTGDTNNTFDAFIRDRLQNTTKLVSKNAAGVPGNFLSYPVNITPNGKNIIFYSLSSDLVSNDTNNLIDAFLYDPDALIIQPPTITSPAGDTYVPGYVNIIGTGRAGNTIMVGVSGMQYTGIISSSGYWQLPPIGPLGNGIYNISAKQIDLSGNVSIEATGTFTMVVDTPTITGPTTNGHTISAIPGYIDVTGIGTGGVGNNIIVVLSGVNYTGTIGSTGAWSVRAGPVTNGTYDIIAYEMDSYGNVGPTDSITIIVDGNSQLPIFSGGAVPVASTQFIRVNVSTNGDQDNGGASSRKSSMTADGRYIVFQSAGSGLVVNDTNGAPDVFVRDVISGTTTRINVDSSGNQDNAGATSFGAVLIADNGRYALFEESNSISNPSNLSVGFSDTHIAATFFVRDIVAGTTRPGILTFTGWVWGGEATAITPDGRYVLFSSGGPIVSGYDDGSTHIYVNDALSGTYKIIDVSNTGVLANSFSYPAAITPDGRYVLFRSFADNLVTGDTNTNSDIFVRDTVSNTTTRVTVTASGVQVNDGSDPFSISSNGRYVLFESDGDNLVAGDTNALRDVFIKDRLSGTVTRINVDASGNQTNGANGSDPTAMTPDGRYVVFKSDATNLIANDTNGHDDVYVKDTVSGTLTMISQDILYQGGFLVIRGSKITPDGRYVAFQAGTYIYIRDMITGITTHITSGANSSSEIKNISSNGRYISLESSASNLVPNDTNGISDLFLYDPLIVVPSVPTIVYPTTTSLLTPGLSDHIIGTGTAGNVISVGFSGATYTGVINGSGYWSILVGPLVDGVYTLNAAETNASGYTSAAVSRTFIVSASTCSITVTPSTGAVGDTISIAGIAQISGAVFSGFDWGDSSGMVANASWYATGSHIYSSAGTYSIVASMKYASDSSSAGLCARSITISAAPGQNQTGGNNGGGGGGGGGGSYGYGGSTATGGTNPWTIPTLVTGTIQPPLRQLVPGPVDVGGIVNSCSSLQGEDAQSYCFAKSIGTTTQDTLEKAAYTREITREELAKVMTQYAIKVMKKVPDTTRTCTYTDITSSDAEMKGYIQKVCQLGLMGVDNNGNVMETFRPKANITRGEYMTVLSRMLYGRKYDVSNEEKNIVPFYEYHMANLIRQNIFTQKQPELEAQRYMVYYTLYRLGKSLQK